MVPEPFFVTNRLAQIFDDLGIRYLIGGSVASSVHGIARSTQDVDIVVDLREEQAGLLAAALSDDFYVDAEMIREAISIGGSFNLLHLATMVKADLFVTPPGPWIDQEWNRRRLHQIGVQESDSVFVASAEDMILQNLERYRSGGGVSDRQWSDVLGIMKVQETALDFAYLERWGAQLEVTDLLDRALEESGLRE